MAIDQVAELKKLVQKQKDRLEIAKRSEISAEHLEAELALLKKLERDLAQAQKDA